MSYPVRPLALPCLILPQHLGRILPNARPPHMTIIGSIQSTLHFVHTCNTQDKIDPGSRPLSPRSWPRPHFASTCVCIVHAVTLGFMHREYLVLRTVRSFCDDARSHFYEANRDRCLALHSVCIYVCMYVCMYCTVCMYIVQ